MSKRTKGFTLIEILIAVILIGIGVAGTIGVLTAGSFFLKRAENKSKAVSVASVQIERYLTRSYSDLITGSYSGSSGKIDWEVDVQEKKEGNCSPDVSKLIPCSRLAIALSSFTRVTKSPALVLSFTVIPLPLAEALL